MMTTERAIEILADWIESKGFEAERAKIKARDLVEWRNIAEPWESDVKQLKRLIASGRFRSWSCPSCDNRVYEGDPEDWGQFQGVQQNDRSSYPGRGPRDRRCDTCRCHNVRPPHFA